MCILGGFVGQPIPGRRVASVTSIAAPIATTITVSAILEYLPWSINDLVAF